MKAESPLEAVARRRSCLMTRRGFLALGLRVMLIGLGLWLVFSQVFAIHRNRGLGMYPAVRDGDLALAYRLQEDYIRGDVVLYRAGEGLHLGRIEALSGDVVLMDDSGGLSVNGTSRDEGILYPTFPREGIPYPQRVQEGMVYILGDYRTQTRDSRDFGAIPLDDILGKVIVLVRRRGL